MSSPASPAETRAFIVERLVGDIGEPDHIIAAARGLAQRSLPAIVQGLLDNLSVAVDVDVKQVELARFSEARPDDATNHAMTIAASASSPDALILSMDAQAIAVLVSLLFGGDPDLPVAAIERELSPTETEVATLVFQEIAQAVNGSGPHAFEFRLPVPAAITGMELKKHILRDGPAVRVVFSVSSKSASGKISLMMPQRVLLKHRGDATVAGAASAAAEPPADDWRQRFSDEVMRSSVNLEATMPLARMTLGEIAGLREGQIIELEENAQTRAHLSARKKTLFVCEFGKIGQNYTVRVRQPYDAGQEFIDGLMPG